MYVYVTASIRETDADSRCEKMSPVVHVKCATGRVCMSYASLICICTLYDVCVYLNICVCMYMHTYTYIHSAIHHTYKKNNDVYTNTCMCVRVCVCVCI